MLAPGLHGAPYFNFFEIDILKFQTIPKNISDVENPVIYNAVKFQLELVCISSYTKMTNSDKSEIFRIWHCSSSQI